MSIRKTISSGFLALALAVGGLALTGVPASASTEFSFLSSFGPGGSGSGTFSSVAGIAVDQSNGTIYVYDPANEAIYKFNSAGEPQEFTALKTDAIEGVGSGEFGEDELAVDSSSGPAKGDIYLVHGVPFGPEPVVKIYGADGKPLGTLHETAGQPWGGGIFPALVRPCGVAVDPAGNVYVGLARGGLGETYVNKYTPVGNPVTNADYALSLTKNITTTGNKENGEICNVAVDGTGITYLRPGNGLDVMKYAASQFGAAEPVGVVIDNHGRSKSFAVDPATNAVYIDEENRVSAYSSIGSLLGSFGESGPGAISGSVGVAVYAPSSTSKKAYVSGGASGTVEIFDVLPLPEASTGEVSGVTPQAATLEGEVSPAGKTLTTCQFKYGPSTSYGSVVPCASIPGPESSLATVSAQIAGLQPKTLYHYKLVISDESETIEGLDRTFTTERSPPTVDDKPAFASGVSQLEATLNGTINPFGVPVAYHFVYGTTSAYGSMIPVPDAYTPIDEEDHQVAPQIVTGLKPGTTYHFALVATDSAGVQVGPDETFTTPPVPAPVVSTGGAGEVSLGAATLSGSIDPRGWETTYHFEYGPSAAYGYSWPTVDVALGVFNGAQPIVSSVQNLAPGTLYHYRLVATSPGGTSYGSDQTFATPEYPASVIQQTPQLAGPFGINPEGTQPNGKPHKHKAKRKTRKKKARKKAKGRRKG